MSASDRKPARLSTPLDPAALRRLRCGQEVLLSGDIFTARDQAHRRLVDLLRKGRRLPFDIRGQVIYYCGPTKTPPGRVIGACGPTTAARMDALTPPLLKAGVRAVIGKGRRSADVRAQLKRHRAVYFLATGGAGAFLAHHVVGSRKVCFADLGPEAVLRLTVKDFPLIVGIDTRGRDIFPEKET
ncbi:MAG: FumA C-terminus/TtdB family hydratase beta subunit [Deltaproteobacteria bacterium]